MCLLRYWQAGGVGNEPSSDRFLPAARVPGSVDWGGGVSSFTPSPGAENHLLIIDTLFASRLLIFIYYFTWEGAWVIGVPFSLSLCI